MKVVKIVLEKEVMFSHKFEEFGFTSTPPSASIRPLLKMAGDQSDHHHDRQFLKYLMNLSTIPKFPSLYFLPGVIRNVKNVQDVFYNKFVQRRFCSPTYEVIVLLIC